jgi:hypothetical protein
MRYGRYEDESSHTVIPIRRQEYKSSDTVIPNQGSPHEMGTRCEESAFDV